MLKRLDKVTAPKPEGQALHSTHAGYTRLELLAVIGLLFLYLIAGSAAPAVWTEAGTVAQGSNYHGF